MDTIYGRLGHLSSHLMLPSQSPRSTDEEVVAIEQAIRDIARHCQKDCDSLLKVIKQMKRGKGHRSYYRSFKTALKTVWKSNEIGELEKRLGTAQQTLALHVCSLAS
ncbi:hypothetical protein PG984_010335 [Apiospora sp. TS-2023a]